MAVPRFMCAVFLVDPLLSALASVSYQQRLTLDLAPSPIVHMRHNGSFFFKEEVRITVAVADRQRSLRTNETHLTLDSGSRCNF
jgi:hypothetical protein